jgi:uncharacterized RDD family membrane protein YckC
LFLPLDRRSESTVPIEFACENCGGLLRVGEQAVSQRVRCPRCRTMQAAANADARKEPAPPRLIVSLPVGATAAQEDVANPYQSPNNSAGVSSISKPGAATTENHAASRWLRLFAAMIDGWILTASRAPSLIIFAMEPRNYKAAYSWDEIVKAAQGISPSYAEWAIFWSVNVVQWTLIANTGQSIGKRLLGTRIVRTEDDCNAGLLRAVILRHWLPLAIIYVAPPAIGLAFYYIDVCWIFLLPSRCLHDIFSGTRVIKIQ